MYSFTLSETSAAPVGGALRKNSLDRSSSFCSKCCKTPQHPPRCRCRCSCSCCYSCCCSWEHSYPSAPFVCERGSLQRFSPIARFGLISLFVFLLFYRIFFRNAIPSPSLERFLIAANSCVSASCLSARRPLNHIAGKQRVYICRDRHYCIGCTGFIDGSGRISLYLLFLRRIPFLNDASDVLRPTGSSVMCCQNLLLGLFLFLCVCFFI